MLDEDELEELLELDELEPVSSSPPQAVSRANTNATGASVRIVMIPLCAGYCYSPMLWRGLVTVPGILVPPARARCDR